MNKPAKIPSSPVTMAGTVLKMTFGIVSAVVFSGGQIFLVEVIGEVDALNVGATQHVCAGHVELRSTLVKPLSLVITESPPGTGRTSGKGTIASNAQ